MEKSIKNAMSTIHGQITDGSITVKQAMERLEGMLILTRELSSGQPISNGINKFASDLAKSVIVANTP